VRVLAVNAGSTSLKLHVVEGDEAQPLERLEDAGAAGVEAVGHRVVHGGSRFRSAVLVTDDVVAEIERLTPIAPLHNAPALDGIRRVRAALPELPQVAAFDTAFHATLPDEAATYAVPRRWREAWGIRRFGFHGLSLEWAAGQVRVPRLVVCHLGGGSSVTAIRDGRPVDTTMGFTPLEGVPMATRSGSVDPGALLYLLREGFVDVGALDRALEHESGLLALGGSGDVRELEGTAPAALAVFEHRVAGAVAAMAAAAEGIDALVFTAGIGEHAAGVRARVCARLRFLGVELDEEANAHATPDAEVGAVGSAVRIVVLRAREELVVARAARRVLARS
jgi:acetate kinase